MRNLLAYPDDARIWIYQANRPLTNAEVNAINEDVEAFCESWTSHNFQLRAMGGIMHDVFLVLVADETAAAASGCSIDKSVHFVKSLEQKYGISLLERDTIAWMDEHEQIRFLPLRKLKEALRQGEISARTRVFDNLVANRKDYLARWVAPLEETWMKRFV